LPDEVSAWLEEWGEEFGVTFEIFVTLPRTLSVGRTVGKHQMPAILEWLLLGEGRRTTTWGPAVDEQGSRPLSPFRDEYTVDGCH
jgi:hypothetical protein